MEKDWFYAALEEYKVINLESTHAGNRIHLCMQIGTSLILIVFGVAFRYWNSDPKVATSILLYILPVLSYLSLLIWLGEYTRLARLRLYNKYMEIKINMYLKHDDQSQYLEAMQWDHWLMQRDSKGNYENVFAIHRYATIGIFVLSIATAFILGIYKGAETIKNTSVFVLNVAIEAGVICGFLVFAYSLGKKAHDYMKTLPREPLRQLMMGR